MFNLQYAVKAYSNVAVESLVSSSNTHQLITLLYDGAIEALHQARIHIESKQIEQKVRLINKAISIINEGLLASLNIEVGGELAHNLERLYEYMTFSLVNANKTNDIKPVDEVIRLLGELREAWMEIDPEKTKLGVGVKSTSGTTPARQFVYS